jgi:Ca2+-binding RTX toxin-like protein
VITTAVNDAPAIGGLAASTTTSDETTVKPFTGFTISDPDNQSGVVETVTITLGNGGGTLSGGGIIANAGVYTLTDTLANIATDMAGIIFTPTAHEMAPGATLTTSFGVSVAQISNGTTATSSSIATSVITTAVNDAPAIGGLAASTTTSDETTVKPFTGFTISDPDIQTGVTETVTITPSNSGGTLSGAGLIASGGAYTLSAPLANIASDMAGLIFTPTAHEVAPGATLTTNFAISVAQISNGTTATSTGAVTSVITTAVNDAPTITGTQSGLATTDESTIHPFATVAIADVDTIGVTETVTITLTSAGTLTPTDANGKLSGTGLTETGSGVYLLTGSASLVTSEIDSLIFTPTAHQVAANTTITTDFAITATQTSTGGAAPVSTTNTTTSVITTATATSISLAGTIASAGTIGHVQTLAPFTNIVITDPNAGATETATVKLTNAAAGTLSLAGGSVDGVSLSVGSGGTYTLSTAIAASVDAALDALIFTPATPAGGGTAFDLTVKDNSAIAAVLNGGTVTVDPGPTAKAVTSSLKLGGSIDLTSAILAAASPGISGDKLTITADSLGTTHGSVSLVNGDLVYTASGTGLSTIPATGTATDSFGYTVSDKYGDTASGTVTVAVSNPAADIYGGIYGNSTINGTSGADIITAYDFNNIINDNGGNDVVYAGQGQATINASTGNVVIHLDGFTNSVTGQNGNDTISGSEGSTTISLGNGTDNIDVGGFNNVVTLGNGNDTVTGSMGSSTLKLGTGNDVVSVTGYDNYISAGSISGTDYIDAGLGNETISGGNGNFVVLAGGYDNTITLGNGTDYVFTSPSGVANPSLPAGTKVPAEEGEAIVTTGSGNDTIILAGYGNVVNAGGGMNFIAGGVGNDTFYLPDAGTGTDTITGFSLTNLDVLNLSTALKAAGWNNSTSTLGNYLKVSESGGNAIIAIAVGGNSSALTVAQLDGVTSLTLTTLQQHAVL